MLILGSQNLSVANFVATIPSKLTINYKLIQTTNERAIRRPDNEVIFRYGSSSCPFLYLISLRTLKRIRKKIR
jgi:transcription-repair coupling factor (superfamily II helicase)